MTLGSRRSALIGLLGAAFVVACGSAPAAAQGKFKAVTTFTVLQDIAQNVAGTAAIVEAITNHVVFVDRFKRLELFSHFHRKSIMLLRSVNT